MKRGFWFKTFRVFLVLLVSILAAVMLVAMKPQAARQERVETGLLVEVMPVSPQTVGMRVETYGTVRPEQTVRFVSEVRGEVMEIHPAFHAGGRLAEGERLLAVDDRMYRLEVERRRVQTVQIEAETRRVQQEIRNLSASIRIARSDTELAQKELDRLNQLADRKVAAATSRDQAEQRYLSSLNRLQTLENQLALTGPTLEQLSAQKQMAEVALKQAELDLAHTVIEAPFDGWVVSRAVDIGQFVPVGQVLGEMFREGRFEIETHIPVAELQWLPATIDADTGLAAEIRFQGGHFHADPLVWEGRLTRLKAGMDEKTRTLPAVVEVRPAQHGVQDTRRLRPGMFVTVQVIGREVENAYALPRHVVQPGGIVYLAVDGQLVFRRVQVIRRQGDTAWIGDGLAPGDRIVTTVLSGATDGMKIRVKEAGDS